MPKPLLSRPEILPEAMPVKAAFARLSAARLYSDRGIPLPLQMSPMLDYLEKALGVRDRQSLTFHIDILQALDSMWREKAISRMS